MRVPESWLRSFVNPPLSTAQLAHKLTMSGAEVEEISPVAPPFTGVVVALVKEVVKHPDADKLNVCQVDIGSGELLNIVCGAPNVRAGIKVPCAMVGAELPNNFKIKLAKVRGIASEGMLCSARELGLSEEQSGLWILDEALRIGTPLREALDLDDQILTLKLTPNKADCLSIYGIARELSAITGVALKQPDFPRVPVSIPDTLPVKLSAPDLCGRFSGRVIRQVNCKAPTPDWMKTRLERAGQRSISALVDISNYVMLELGRPSHIFDLDKIRGHLHVRWGQPGETLKLLNGNTISLDAQVGVIADEQQVESLAGIMGGEATAVNDDTRNIYVEAAFWWPDAIRGRARRYNFLTDAAHRFERGVDYANIVEHLEYISQLILQICGGKAGPIDDTIVQLPQRKAVKMRTARCCQVIGTSISPTQIAEIFTRLGFSFTQNETEFVVQTPSYRFDVEIEEDLIEEVARIWGYENLPERPPQMTARLHSLPQACRTQHGMRRALAALGYSEVVNFSFVEAQWEQDFAGNTAPIKLLNPIASNLAVMRSSLIGSLVQNLVQNLRHRASSARIFEIARVFRFNPTVSDGPLTVGGIDQPLHMAALAYGPVWPEQWGRKSRHCTDFFDLKGDLEYLAANFAPGLQLQFIAAEHPALHPGRCAQIVSEGRAIGHVGELHPRWMQKYEISEAPVLFECLLQPWLHARVPVYKEIARTPTVVRDLAVVMHEQVSWSQIDAALNIVATQVQGRLKLWHLFDVYRGTGLQENEKSLALRLWLQDTEETLTEEKVEQIQQVVINELAKCGASLRM
ncbi:MAG: phenylalanine--tRNA ligase subunit beta [Burkholderiaceae bacterium]|nr:phenylalanine--tRNA ligase subunit beta [Burkholderiaceae bacterium]